MRRGGRAVTGAKVCLSADMPDMQHPGVGKVAKEASGGRYELNLKFEMVGALAASVTGPLTAQRGFGGARSSCSTSSQVRTPSFSRFDSRSSLSYQRKKITAMISHR